MAFCLWRLPKNGAASFPPVADIIIHNSHKQLIINSLSTYIIATHPTNFEALNQAMDLRLRSCTSIVTLLYSTKCFTSGGT